MQLSLWHETAGNGRRPLLVGLHTWSFDRFNQVEEMLPMAQELGWNLLLPEFRAEPEAIQNGAQACGSIYAVQDILDAVEHVLANYEINKDRIYLLEEAGRPHGTLNVCVLSIGLESSRGVLPYYRPFQMVL